MVNEEAESREVPPVEEAFAHLLKKYGVGVKAEMAETITENISRTGGEHVFDRPEIMAERLTSWHEYITPVKRKQILQHWFAERGIEVPEEIAQAVGLKPAEMDKKKTESAKKNAEESGKVWTISEHGKVRPAKEGEFGITFEEAKAAVQELYGEEPPVIFDAERGTYLPNPSSKLMATHPVAVQMTVREMNRVMAAGEEADPLEVMMGEVSKVEQFKELVGAKSDEPAGRPMLTEVVGALKELDEMRAAKGAGGEESLRNALDYLHEHGLLGERDTAVKEQLTTLQQQIETLREDKRKAELEAMEERHKADRERDRADREALLKDVQTLGDGISALRQELHEGKKVTSEYDIMSQLITSAKDELTGFRTDLKTVFGPTKPLPPARETAEAMGEEMGRLEEADRLAEELWFKD